LSQEPGETFNRGFANPATNIIPNKEIRIQYSLMEPNFITGKAIREASSIARRKRNLVPCNIKKLEQGIAA
jgi:hypothetical protein